MVAWSLGKLVHEDSQWWPGRSVNWCIRIGNGGLVAR